jgi:AcrR family transcriptional regulator
MPPRKSPKPKPPPRRRLPADEARARILEAAERKLAEVGPERLRLTDLAAELGISHPAILHHFGSREELVSAVLAHAIKRINQRLADVITGRSADAPNAVLDMVAEYYGAEGRARTLGWLVLSEGAPQVIVDTQAARPLQALIELVHAQRKKSRSGRSIELADSKFMCHLAAFALLGEALFGDLVRAASGDAIDAKASREFRRRFARLLTQGS